MGRRPNKKALSNEADNHYEDMESDPSSDDDGDEDWERSGGSEDEDVENEDSEGDSEGSSDERQGQPRVRPLFLTTTDAPPLATLSRWAQVRSPGSLAFNLLSLSPPQRPNMPLPPLLVRRSSFFATCSLPLATTSTLLLSSTLTTSPLFKSQKIRSTMGV